MRKTQVALAALALLASTAAMAAEVSISGVMDVGIASTSKTNGVGGVFLENGAYNDHSALELNIGEDLGSGLKAYASLGMGFNPNGQSDNPGVGRGLSTANDSIGIHNNSLFNRQAFVGVSGEFGSIQLGRQLSPFVLSNVLMQNYIGMFGVGRMVLAGAGGTAGAFFVDNSVSYKTPAIAGFTLTAFATTPNGTRGNAFIDGADTDRYTAYHVNGSVGAANLTAAYHKQNSGWSGWNAGGTMSLMDGLTASLGYVNTESAAGLKVGSWNMGASYALTGATTVTAQHAFNDDNGGNQKLSNIMLANALSKRTTVYAGYGWADGNIGATIGTFGGTVDSTTSAAGTSIPAAGKTNSAFVVGVSHSF